MTLFKKIGKVEFKVTSSEIGTFYLYKRIKGKWAYRQHITKDNCPSFLVDFLYPEIAHEYTID